MNTWHAVERYGLVWVWVGDGEPDRDVPSPPGLDGDDIAARAGRPFTKGCHPNVVLVNAIDEHHFQTVHGLPGEILDLQAETIDQQTLLVENKAPIGRTTRLGRLIGRFYREGSIYYTLRYSNGATGGVSLGPDFQRLHFMFALRPTPGGKTEGVTIVCAKRHMGPAGWAWTRLLLGVSKLATMFFAHGDTKVFESIKFKLGAPIAADRTVVRFIRHSEQQKTVDWMPKAEPEGGQPDDAFAA